MPPLRSGQVAIEPRDAAPRIDAERRTCGGFARSIGGIYGGAIVLFIGLKMLGK